MVTFELVNKEEDKIICKYFPEGHTDKEPGLITIKPSTSEYDLEPAEEDFLCFTSVAELNEMRDAINQMRIERGAPKLIEEEMPSATEGEEWYQYADHAIRRIFEEYKKGNIPEKGTVAWY